MTFKDFFCSLVPTCYSSSSHYSPPQAQSSLGNQMIFTDLHTSCDFPPLPVFATAVPSTWGVLPLSTPQSPTLTPFLSYNQPECCHHLQEASPKALQQNLSLAWPFAFLLTTFFFSIPDSPSKNRSLKSKEWCEPLKDKRWVLCIFL